MNCTSKNKMLQMILAIIVFNYISVFDFLFLQITPDFTDESPPSKIDVERPQLGYNFGDYGVVMDQRNSMVLRCTAAGDPAPT